MMSSVLKTTVSHIVSSILVVSVGRINNIFVTSSVLEMYILKDYLEEIYR